MTLLRSAVILAAVALLPTGAAAQGTPEQRAACTGDAFSFCGGDIPDVARVTACLRRNVSRISPACQAQFGRGSAQRSRQRATPVADAASSRHAVY